MTTVQSVTPAAGAQARSELAVDTGAVDELRATVRVDGTLDGATVPLLTGVLDAHRRSGRRYLRVELGRCRLTDLAVLEPLRSQHAALAEAGGMLVFVGADDIAAALLRRGDLFVTPAAVQPG
jgi:hypothetical protein